MNRLPISVMLMDVFAGALAVLMLVAAALLAVLIAMNASRGDTDMNGQLMVLAAVFGALAVVFYLLKRWAKARRA